MSVKININGVEIDMPKEELLKNVEAGKIEFKNENLIAKTDFDKRIETMTAELDDRYSKGKVAGEEMTIKEMAKITGISDVVKKPEEFIEKYKGHVLKEAKIEPSEKIKEYETKIGTLTENLKQQIKEKDELSATYQKKEQDTKISFELFSILPDKNESNKLEKKHIAGALAADGFSFTMKNGQVISIKDGKEIVNPITTEPLPLKEAIAPWLTERGFFAKEGGRGAGDITPPAKGGTVEAFNKEMENAGHKYGSDAYYNEMSKRVKEGTLKV